MYLQLIVGGQTNVLGPGIEQRKTTHNVLMLARRRSHRAAETFKRFFGNKAYRNLMEDGCEPISLRASPLACGSEVSCPRGPFMAHARHADSIDLKISSTLMVHLQRLRFHSLSQAISRRLLMAGLVTEAKLGRLDRAEGVKG